MILKGHFKAMLNFYMHFSIPRLCRYNKKQCIGHLSYGKKKEANSEHYVAHDLVYFLEIDVYRYIRILKNNNTMRQKPIYQNQ